MRSRPPTVAGGDAAPPVVGRHRRQLESLMDLLRVSLELETRCDFGDGLRPGGPGRAAFVAHFSGWQEALEDWDERVRRARLAPSTLWSFLDDAARDMGLPEPPVARGAVVDKLAMLTAQRSREEHLGIRQRLFVQTMPSGHGSSASVTVYVEGQSVAQVAAGNEALATSLADAVQRLFDTAQETDAAREVGRSWDAVQEAKHDLLKRLNALAAADSISFSPACAICAAGLRPVGEGFDLAAAEHRP